MLLEEGNHRSDPKPNLDNVVPGLVGLSGLRQTFGHYNTHERPQDSFQGGTG